MGIGMDISDQQTAKEKINQLIAGQAFLYQTSFGFTDLPKDDDIFDTIGSGVKEILPDATVVVNGYDFYSTEVDALTRCCLGDRERELFSQIIGRDIVGMSLKAPYAPGIYHLLQNLLGGKIVKVPGDLYFMLQEQIPRDSCQRIEEALNIGDMYAIGLASQKVIFGNVIIFLRKGDILENHETIEIFIKQATLALKCRFMEEGTKIPPSLAGIIDHIPPSI